MIENLIPTFVMVIFIILVVSLLLKLFRQPYVIAYIVAGMILGPSLLGVVQDKQQWELMGEIGIIMLMFFIGMEVSFPKLLSKWRIAIVGSILQILLNATIIYILGSAFDWSLMTSVFAAFIITLSSTAVVMKILEELDELHTKVGQNVLGILIVQDILVIPMMLIIGLLGGEQMLGIAMLGKLAKASIMGLIVYLIVSKKIRISISNSLFENHELRLFMALIVCFGLAAITSALSLSAPLGAFLGGMIVSSYREKNWIHSSLHSFKIMFVALFFVYIGILIDVDFLLHNIMAIVSLVLVVFIINTVTNTVILYSLGVRLKESIYAGSLLAQIGEFSFLLGAVGLSSGIILEYEYNLLISVISVSLLLSPLWITLMKKVVRIDANYIFERFKSIELVMSTLHKRR